MSKTLIIAASVLGLSFGPGGDTPFPRDYRGTAYKDSTHTAGPQIIPGKVQCAYFDIGGEGVAYHDEDAINHGSGELNLQAKHQRPHADASIWQFREKEGVDLSYAKDFADLNHPNLVVPDKNQLYIGWAKDGEWCNYTVMVKAAGTYKIIALYGNAANTIKFSVNNVPAAFCKFPVATGSMHKWNKAEIGTITFSEAGTHLLTFHYNAGNNFAYFEFVPAGAE